MFKIQLWVCSAAFFLVSCGGGGGGGSSQTATLLTAVNLAPQVVAGEYYSCALTNAGGVKCWGSNANGQLGTGVTCPTGAYANQSCSSNIRNPQDVFGLTNGVIQISTSANSQRTCALKSDSTVWCWGAGYLGDGSTDRSDIPIKVTGFSGTPVQIATDNTHSCMLMADATVKCWGTNIVGELGNGNFVNQTNPVSVSGLSNVKTIAIGSAASCAILNTGSVKCWGGMPGNGTSQSGPTASSVPVSIVGATISNVSSIAVGGSNVCLVDGNSGLKCWGAAQNGQIPTYGTLYGFVPTPGGANADYVPNLNANISLATVGDLFLCVLSNNTVKCQGQNAFGALGDGSTDGSLAGATLKTPTGLISNVVSLSSGSYHSCAVTSIGEIKCWGSGAYEVLQNGNAGSTIPTAMSGISNNLMLRL